MKPTTKNKIFFSDNGSTAVEVAIKVALQYFFNKGEKKTTIIAFENAFHGDTFAAMAASGISFYTQAFEGMFIDIVRIPVPIKGQEEASFQALAKAIKNNSCAGFIFEPLVQGAAGMVMYEPEALDKLIKKSEEIPSVLTKEDEEKLKPVFEGSVNKDKFRVEFESMSSSEAPIIITQPEFIRRMMEQQRTGGGGFMGAFPEMYQLVVSRPKRFVVF